MKKRLLQMGIVTLLVVSMLTGCGKSVHGQFNCEQMNQQYNAACAEIQRLQGTQTSVGLTCAPTRDGTFVEHETMYIFQDIFGYPNASAGVPGYEVVFNESTCSISPSASWVVDSVDSVIYVYNEELGISGEFSYGRHTEGAACSKDVLKDYLTSWTSVGENIRFKDIYLENSAIQGQAVTFEVSKETNPNNSDLTIHCGLIGDSKYDITYVFVYKGTYDDNRNNAIVSLLTTLKINGLRLCIQ